MSFDPSVLGFRMITENEMHVEREDEFDISDEDAPFNVIYVEGGITRVIINNTLEGVEAKNEPIIGAFLDNAVKSLPNPKDVFPHIRAQQPSGITYTILKKEAIRGIINILNAAKLEDVEALIDKAEKRWEFIERPQDQYEEVADAKQILKVLKEIALKLRPAA